MTYFGWKHRLLTRCSADPTYDDQFEPNLDEQVVSALEKKLSSVVTTDNKHLSFIAFYNNHNPYKWGAAASGISKNVGDKEDFSEIRTTINRYKNSVVASEINFQRIKQTIDSLPGGQDKIVILLSDHGEMLYEKNRESAHGGIPFEEKIRILLGIQFPTSAKLNSKNTSTIASISDVFPTLFDYMGITPLPNSDWIVGKSLLTTTRNSLVSVKSNKDDPTREMALINRTEKAWIKVEDSNFYDSKTLTLYDYTNLDDHKIDNPCKNKSPEDCKNELIRRFPDAMHELYPSIAVAANRLSSPHLRAPAARKNSGKKHEKKL